jgi:DNA-binding MarR family transcriptional regulator
MNNKKLGVIFLALSVITAGIVLNLMSGLTNEANALGCYSNPSCVKIQSNLTITNFAFGVLGFLFSLGFYLIAFAKGEELLLKRLDAVDEKLSDEEKFSLLLKGLDEYEKKVVQTVKEQDGITQNTLRLKSDMSKAKLSYVLHDLEKKGLIKRIPKGKTLSVYLKELGERSFA